MYKAGQDNRGNTDKIVLKVFTDVHDLEAIRNYITHMGGVREVKLIDSQDENPDEGMSLIKAYASWDENEARLNISRILQQGLAKSIQAGRLSQV